MKKIIKVFSLLLILFMLTACGEKKVLSTKEIDKILSDNGFSVIDSTRLMKDKNIEKVVSANNGMYQIEYYVFVDEALAKKAFDGNKETFENMNKKKGKEESSEKFQKYTQKLSDTYNVVIRMENKLIYASVNIEYKSNLNKVIKKMGY